MLTNGLDKISENTYEAVNSVGKRKNRTQTGHTSDAIPFPTSANAPAKRDKSPVRAGRDHVNYWKTKVRPRVIRGTPTSELYCRLHEARREAWICLNTSNRATAAERARDHYLRMRAIGLPALLAEIRPEAKPDRVCTVGEYLAAAKPLSAVRERTLAEYEASFRRVVAGVRGIVAKSNQHKVRAAWRAKVDAVRLDQFTPADVKAWQKRELDAALRDGGETKKDRRAATLASHLRDARALFSEAILAEAGKKLTLPDELPFAGVTAAAVTRRFVATVDASELYAAAASLDPDTRTAFDLLLVAGLRRGEADALPWAHVDLDAGTVRVDVTDTFRPKSRESYRTVPLPVDVVERLKERRAQLPNASLVLEGRKTRPPRKPSREKRSVYEYRAKAWEPLTQWLRENGVTDLTPLHSLRKMSGSFVYTVAGLEAARQHLGHRDVSTTARSYLATRAAVVDFSGKF